MCPGQDYAPTLNISDLSCYGGSYGGSSRKSRVGELPLCKYTKYPTKLLIELKIFADECWTVCIFEPLDCELIACDGHLLILLRPD